MAKKVGTASLPLLSPSHSSSVTEEMSPPLTFLLLLLSSSSFSSFFPPSPLPHSSHPRLRCSSEGHELKLPLGLPLRHPHRVGGVLRYLHDADGERLISLVDMVSHYLAGGEGRQQGELAHSLYCSEGHKACGSHSSWGVTG